MVDIKPDVEKLKKEEDVDSLMELLDYHYGFERPDDKIFKILRCFYELSESDEYEFPLYGELPLSIDSQILAVCDEVVNVRMEAAKALVEIGEKAIEPLRRELMHGHRGNREMMAWILGEIGSQRAIKPLIEALKYSGHDSFDVHEDVINSLVKIGEPAVDSLIQALDDEDTLFRSNVREALEGIGKPAVPQLIQALKCEKKNIRREAAYSLATIGGEEALEPLLAALGDEDAEVRANAARALGRIGGSRAVEPLIKALKDKEPLVREYTVDALGSIGDSRAFQILVSAMEDEDEDVRRAAVYALNNFGRLAVEPLVKAMGRSDIRRYALDALESIKDPGTVELFIQALEEKDLDDFVSNVSAAVDALGNFGGERAAETLIHALKRAEEGAMWWLREKVAGALTNMGQPAVKPLIQALGDEYICDFVIREILEKMELSQELLINAFENKDWRIRKGLVRALGRIESERRRRTPKADNKTLDFLVTRALKDEAPQVRVEAARSLGKIGGRRAMEALANILADSELEVRVEAAKSLGEIGGRRAMEALANFLRDDAPEVRAEVAKALREIVEGSYSRLCHIFGRIRERLREKLRDEKILKPLLDAAEDRNPDVRGAAIWTLVLLRGDERVTSLIVKGLRDEDRYVRLRAVDSAHLGLPEKELDALIPLLKDEYWRVRKKVVTILGNEARYGEIDKNKVLEYITPATRDEYPEVRREARKAIIEIKEMLRREY
ncbi:MAG: HEAT repeat domain-containing protein [Candidatus Freyarchaeota archaeon]|nr:HEAT repeat domain-containing protein [Candidatus Jordarchaeia archaeon]